MQTMSDFFRKNKTTLFTVVLVVFVVLGGYFLFSFYIKNNKNRQVVDYKSRLDNNNQAYIDSLIKDDPTTLQKNFLNDVKSGVNDKFTKSDAYFLTHRFFDNYGNIYEIHDYVKGHPELDFIEKGAEKIYPKIFEDINNNKLSKKSNNNSYYAVLAYIEVLVDYGYTDIAALGTLANQYSRFGYFRYIISKASPSMSPKDKKANLKMAERDIQKALEYVALSDKIVADIVDKKITENDMTARDILVGLNQYGASLRYLEAYGIKATSTKTSKEVFDFTSEYAYKNVPVLVNYTALLNASTLKLASSSSSGDIRVALYPILDSKLGKVKERTVISKIIDSRFDTPPKTASGSLDSRYWDSYSKRNVVSLSKKVPEFKAWLMKNGWVEEDFKMDKFKI